MIHRYPTICIKGSLVLLWLVLFVLLLQRDYFVKSLENLESIALARDARIEFQGVYFKNSKIGYVETEYIPEGDGLRIMQQATMRLNISGETHPIDLSLSARLSADGILEKFDFEFSSLFYRMKATGKVAGTVVSFSLDTGNTTIDDVLVMQEPPMLSTSRRQYLFQEGLSAGDKLSVPWFDPFSLSSKNSTLEYRGKEQVLILDRVYHLHRFIEHFSGTRISSWLDDDGNVIKEESPAGFVFIQEPEFKAKTIDSSMIDLLATVAAKLKGPMPENLSGRSMMRYRLNVPSEHSFDLDKGRQKLDGNIVTLHKETIPEPNSHNGASCADEDNTLASSAYIQADAEEIIHLSSQLTATRTNSADTVRKLARWVFEEIEKRPVIGIPDALTTLNNRRGDCNEHASLFAALARAADIPTKIIAGVVYHKGAFYYHAWNEVCISKQWISIDTTTMQFPADLSHIKFIEGEFKEQVKIGSLLGTLEIEVLPSEQ